MNNRVKEVTNMKENIHSIAHRQINLVNVKLQPEFEELAKLIKWFSHNQNYPSDEIRELASTIQGLLYNRFCDLPKRERLLLFDNFCKLPKELIQPTAEDCREVFTKVQNPHDVNFGHMTVFKDGETVSKCSYPFHAGDASELSRTGSSTRDSQLEAFLSLFVGLLLSRMAQLRPDVSEGFEELQRERATSHTNYFEGSPPDRDSRVTENHNVRTRTEVHPAAGNNKQEKHVDQLERKKSKDEIDEQKKTQKNFFFIVFIKKYFLENKQIPRDRNSGQITFIRRTCKSSYTSISGPNTDSQDNK